LVLHDSSFLFCAGCWGFAALTSKLRMVKESSLSAAFYFLNLRFVAFDFGQLGFGVAQADV
jgi:hypothetical protein